MWLWIAVHKHLSFIVHNVQCKYIIIYIRMWNKLSYRYIYTYVCVHPFRKASNIQIKSIPMPWISLQAQSPSSNPYGSYILFYLLILAYICRPCCTCFLDASKFLLFGLLHVVPTLAQASLNSSDGSWLSRLWAAMASENLLPRLASTPP